MSQQGFTVVGTSLRNQGYESSPLKSRREQEQESRTFQILQQRLQNKSELDQLHTHKSWHARTPKLTHGLPEKRLSVLLPRRLEQGMNMNIHPESQFTHMSRSQSGLDPHLASLRHSWGLGFMQSRTPRTPKRQESTTT